MGELWEWNVGEFVPGKVELHHKFQMLEGARVDFAQLAADRSLRVGVGVWGRRS